MRNIVLLTIYFAVVIRAVAFHFYDDPVPLITYGFLAAYGILLASYPALSQRIPRYTGFYLLLQFALVMAAQFSMPSIDFLISLFFPLSFQAVFSYGRRTGFAIITVGLVGIFFPIMVGWEWQIEGVAVFVLNAAACFLVGNYAHLILASGRADQSNQRLSRDLQQANQKLQELALQREELAVLQERSRMARELHDSVTQTIFSMNLTVQSVRMLVEQDLSQVAAQLDRLQDLASSAVGEIQVLISQLRPQTDTEAGLLQALQELLRQRQIQDGLQVELQILGDRQLPQTTILGLYRIVQEALNNVAKHAGTLHALIRLDLQDRPAYLEIEDHGCGFDTGQVPADPSHLGLAGMADRAQELGWKMSIHSRPGQGTRIRVEEVEAWQPNPAPIAA